MIQLFGIPYAGGGKTSFAGWDKKLTPYVQLVTVELSGRDARTYEPLYETLHDCVEDICRWIRMRMREDSFAIYGHSMGALLGYEVAHRLHTEGLSPLHLIVSGREAPQLVNADRKAIHKLPDRELIDHVVGLGGTPPEIFEYPELTKLVLHRLRSDFKIIETSHFAERNSKLPCPITVLYGESEGIAEVDARAWSVHTSAYCSVRRFPGDHFFIYSQEDSVLSFVLRSLLHK